MDSRGEKKPGGESSRQFGHCLGEFSECYFSFTRSRQAKPLDALEKKSFKISILVTRVTDNKTIDRFRSRWLENQSRQDHIDRILVSGKAENDLVEAHRIIEAVM